MKELTHKRGEREEGGGGRVGERERERGRERKRKNQKLAKKFSEKTGTAKKNKILFKERLPL